MISVNIVLFLVAALTIFVFFRLAIKGREAFQNLTTCLDLKADDRIWEKSEIMGYNNCYAYAFTDLDSNRRSKPQPGFKSNIPPLTREQYACGPFIERVLKDHPQATYLGNDPELAYRDCGCSNHMVFLALDNEGENRDYHFYRRNSDFFWTHKPGSLEVLHVDAAGNKITNPAYADRTYRNFNYNKTCGFFCTPTHDILDV